MSHYSEVNLKDIPKDIESIVICQDTCKDCGLKKLVYMKLSHDYYYVCSSGFTPRENGYCKMKQLVKL